MAGINKNVTHTFLSLNDLLDDLITWLAPKAEDLEMLKWQTVSQASLDDLRACDLPRFATIHIV